MSRRRKRKSYKAFDPFCQDKVRVALYNRPNGPHMGKLIMGKTYLSGLDGKCFSRTGRIKKGYRNIPIDLQREFEIEKRQITEIRDMIHRSKAKKKKKKKAAQKQQQKFEKLAIEQSMQIENNSDTNTNNKIENTNNNLINHQNKNKVTIEKPIQSMKELKRLPNESLNEFIKRVNNTTHYSLNHKQMKKKFKWEQKRLEKKMRKIQQKTEIKKQKKLERIQKIKEKKHYENKWRIKKEYIPFGATNNGPPEDLHALGAKLFKKKGQKGKLNENNVNVSSLTFANIIKNRAEQMKKDGILRNYALMKQKRWKTRKTEIKNKKGKRNNW